MAMGERAPLAVLNAPASGRMAVAEALTNIAAARIGQIGDVKLSANWMAAAGHPGEDARLFDTVRAVGMELCPALGIAIPVGKDSLSMKTVWEERGERKSVVAPLSLIVSAFAPVLDVRRTLTPQLRIDFGDTDLILIDLGRGKNRLGGSALAQVYNRWGDTVPDVDSPEDLAAFFTAIQDVERGGAAVGLSRPFRWWLVGDAGGNVFRRRLWADRVAGRSGRKPADCAVRGGAGRGAPSAGDGSKRGAGAVGRRRAGGMQPRHRCAKWGRSADSTLRRRNCLCRQSRGIAAAVVGNQLPDAGVTRSSRLRPRGVRGGLRSG
jgi:hypothetical protein